MLHKSTKMIQNSKILVWVCSLTLLCLTLSCTAINPTVGDPLVTNLDESLQGTLTVPVENTINSTSITPQDTSLIEEELFLAEAKIEVRDPLTDELIEDISCENSDEFGAYNCHGDSLKAHLPFVVIATRQVGDKVTVLQSLVDVVRLQNNLNQDSSAIAATLQQEVYANSAGVLSDVQTADAESLSNIKQDLIDMKKALKMHKFQYTDYDPVLTLEEGESVDDARLIQAIIHKEMIDTLMAQDEAFKAEHEAKKERLLEHVHTFVEKSGFKPDISTKPLPKRVACDKFHVHLPPVNMQDEHELSLNRCVKLGKVKGRKFKGKFKQGDGFDSKELDHLDSDVATESDSTEKEDPKDDNSVQGTRVFADRFESISNRIILEKYDAQKSYVEINESAGKIKVYEENGQIEEIAFQTENNHTLMIVTHESGTKDHFTLENYDSNPILQFISSEEIDHESKKLIRRVYEYSAARDKVLGYEVFDEAGQSLRKERYVHFDNEPLFEGLVENMMRQHDDGEGTHHEDQTHGDENQDQGNHEQENHRGDDRHHPLFTESDLAQVAELELSHREITHLNGIEHLPNLKKLNLKGNPINDYSPLDQLNLEVLRTDNLDYNFPKTQTLMVDGIELSYLEKDEIRADLIEDGETAMINLVKKEDGFTHQAVIYKALDDYEGEAPIHWVQDRISKMNEAHLFNTRQRFEGQEVLGLMIRSSDFSATVLEGLPLDDTLQSPEEVRLTYIPNEKTELGVYVVEIFSHQQEHYEDIFFFERLGDNHSTNQYLEDLSRLYHPLTGPRFVQTTLQQEVYALNLAPDGQLHLDEDYAKFSIDESLIQGAHVPGWELLKLSAQDELLTLRINSFSPGQDQNVTHEYWVEMDQENRLTFQAKEEGHSLQFDQHNNNNIQYKEARADQLSASVIDDASFQLIERSDIEMIVLTQLNQKEELTQAVIETTRDSGYFNWAISQFSMVDEHSQLHFITHESEGTMLYGFNIHAESYQSDLFNRLELDKNLYENTRIDLSFFPHQDPTEKGIYTYVINNKNLGHEPHIINDIALDGFVPAPEQEVKEFVHIFNELWHHGWIMDSEHDRSFGLHFNPKSTLHFPQEDQEFRPQNSGDTAYWVLLRQGAQWILSFQTYSPHKQEDIYHNIRVSLDENDNVVLETSEPFILRRHEQDTGVVSNLKREVIGDLAVEVHVSDKRELVTHSEADVIEVKDSYDDQQRNILVKLRQGEVASDHKIIEWVQGFYQSGEHRHPLYPVGQRVNGEDVMGLSTMMDSQANEPFIQLQYFPNGNLGEKDIYVDYVSSVNDFGPEFISLIEYKDFVPFPREELKSFMHIFNDLWHGSWQLKHDHDRAFKLNFEPTGDLYVDDADKEFRADVSGWTLIRQDDDWHLHFKTYSPHNEEEINHEIRIQVEENSENNNNNEHKLVLDESGPFSLVRETQN